MRVLLILLISLVYCGAVNSQNIELRNVNWFDGSIFQKGSIYIVDHLFDFKRPKTVDEVISLEGKYIIPPFGEAHTHNLCSAYGVDDIIDQYIQEGTLYIQVLGGSQKGRESVSNNLAASPLEVMYANGGITCTLGHPFTIYEPLAMGIHSPAEKRKRGKEISESRLAENDAYWFFDSLEDIDHKWNALIESKPDIIKIMLLDAQNYDALYNNPKRLGGKGLSAEVAEQVVLKAKEQGLSVYAHVETAMDFDLAVRIGVNVIAHIPGYSWKGDESKLDKYVLKKKSLKRAAANKVSVITTASLSMNYLKAYKNGKPTIDQAKLTRVIAYQKDLLKRLQKNKIKIALGSDQYAKTLFTEVDYLYDNQILDGQTILNTICTTNPQLIYPNRKIGAIRNGYEASFLVLNGNPLLDFTQLKSIEAIYKQGQLIGK